MLDILDNVKTVANIPLIVRLVKPFEGFGRPIEDEGCFTFERENNTTDCLIEFYDGRHLDGYHNVGIGGTFVVRYDLNLFSDFDFSVEYVDLDDSSDEYRISGGELKRAVRWAERTKPLMVGRTDELTLSNCAGYSHTFAHADTVSEWDRASEEIEADNEQEGFPIPETQGGIQRLMFTQKAQGNPEMQSLGRNGWMKTLGIEIVSADDGTVSIAPINSREERGRCEIRIPKDRGHLEALVDIYQSILSGLDEPSSE